MLVGGRLPQHSQRLATVMRHFELRAYGNGREDFLQQPHLGGIIFHEQNSGRLTGWSLHPRAPPSTKHS
jgi:hypothetical protein